MSVLVVILDVTVGFFLKSFEAPFEIIVYHSCSYGAFACLITGECFYCIMHCVTSCSNSLINQTIMYLQE